MAEVEKKEVEVEAEEEVVAEEPEVTESETEEEAEGSKAEHSNSNTEFEDALKRERELGRKEGAADVAFKVRDKKRKGEDSEEDEEGEEPEEDKPLTKKELDAALAQHNQRTMKILQAGQISQIAKKLAKSDSEADLIIEIHKNRFWPAELSMEEQLEEAHAIANRKRLPAQNEELKRSLRHKDTRSEVNAGAHRDASESGEPRPSKDITAIKASGYQWDGTRQIYKKSLAKGKTLFYDPKKKKTWVE